jgi:hypothetical protein
MLLPILISLALSPLSQASRSSLTPSQTPFVPPLSPPGSTSLSRPLKGRFIHLTDLHPDPFYKAGTDEDEACHFNKKKHKKKKRKDKGKGKGLVEVGGDDLKELEEEEEDEVALFGKDGSRKAGYWGLPVSYAISLVPVPSTIVLFSFSSLSHVLRFPPLPHLSSSDGTDKSLLRAQGLRLAHLPHQRDLRLAGKGVQGGGGFCRLDGGQRSTWLVFPLLHFFRDLLYLRPWRNAKERGVFLVLR